jgi:hypothetical protein
VRVLVLENKWKIGFATWPAILALRRQRLGGLYFQSSLGKSLWDLSQPMKASCGDICLSFRLCRKNKLENCSLILPKHNARPYLKNNPSKKGWGMAQRLKSLPSKCKVLSSTPSASHSHRYLRPVWMTSDEMLSKLLT